MKILLTHERFPPDFAGGGEYVVLETARTLIGRGIHVQVLTTGDPGIREYDGIPTRRLPIHRFRMNFAVREIAEEARKCDLILTYNYHACLASRSAGRLTHKPVICTIMGFYQDAWIRMRGPVLGRLWMLLERYQITRDFSRLVFPSDHSREMAVSLGVPREATFVNPPGIHFPPAGLSAGKEDVVLFSGKLDVRKGLLDIFEVARRLPAVRFRLIVWGPDESFFRQRAPSNVEFVPFERGRPLQEGFARARIFLFPSYAETFGLAIAEAMAAGCAIVSTIPLEYRGVRVQPGDCDGMTEAVSRLWSDRALTEQMGRENKELSKYYTWDRHVDCILRMADEVLPGAKA